MFIKLLLTILIFASSIIASNEINVYSHRNYYADIQLFKMFEKETNIKINLIKLDSSELIKKIYNDGEKTNADVLITVDATRLVYAQFKNLLHPIQSKKLEKNIPNHLRQKDGYWFGLTKRARVIVYNKKRVKSRELSTYEDLATNKWKGKVLIGKSSELYNLSLVSAFIANKGEESVSSWAKGIVKNMARKPSEGDTSQIKAIASRRGDVAIINTYYLGKLLKSK